QETVTRMGNLAPREVLHLMVTLPRLTAADLADASKAQAWVDQLNASLPDAGRSGTHFHDELSKDHGRSSHNVLVRVITHSTPRDYLLDHDFFTVSGYIKLATMSETLAATLEEGAFIQRGERTFVINDFWDAIQWL